MSNKNDKNTQKNKKDRVAEQDGRYGNDATSAIPGINTPGIELPAFNPPIPNRAWTAMRNGMDFEELTPEEREEMYNSRPFLD